MTYITYVGISRYDIGSKAVTEFCWFWLRFWTVFPHLPGGLGSSDPEALSALPDVPQSVLCLPHSL